MKWITLLLFLLICISGCLPSHETNLEDISPTMNLTSTATLVEKLNTPLLTSTYIELSTSTPSLPPKQFEPVEYGSWLLISRVSSPRDTYIAGFWSEKNGIAAGAGGDVRITNDAGNNWKKAENNTLCRFGLEIVDENIAWHCGNGGIIGLSLDGGRAWHSAGLFGPDIPNQCRFLSFLDDKVGWAATPVLLGSTSDGGKTWQEINPPEGIQQISSIELRSPNNGYLLDKNGGLFITQNGGQNWSEFSIGLQANEFFSNNTTPLVAMQFMDEQRGKIVYQVQKKIWIANTYDGGQTWQRAQIPKLQDMFAIFLSQDGNLLTLFDGSQIYLLRSQE